MRADLTEFTRRLSRTAEFRLSPSDFFIKDGSPSAFISVNNTSQALICLDVESGTDYITGFSLTGENSSALTATVSALISALSGMEMKQAEEIFTAVTGKLSEENENNISKADFSGLSCRAMLTGKILTFYAGL